MVDQRRPAFATEPMELESKASPVVGEFESGGPEFPAEFWEDGSLVWGDDAEWWDEGNEEWDGGSEWLYDYWFDPSQAWHAPWWFDYFSWYDPSWCPETNGDDMSWDWASDATWCWYEEPLEPTPAIEDPLGCTRIETKTTGLFCFGGVLYSI